MHLALRTTSVVLMLSAALAAFGGISPADPSPAPSAELRTPQTPEAAHDALVSLVAGAASLVDGEPLVTSQGADTCLSGAEGGVQFYLDVVVPSDADPAETYAQVLELWASGGVTAPMQTVGMVTGFDAIANPVDGPAAALTIGYWTANGTYPTHFEIRGVSQCAPGDPADYADFTR